MVDTTGCNPNYDFDPDVIHNEAIDLCRNILRDPGVTDIHLTEGRPIWIRSGGEMQNTSVELKHRGIMTLSQKLLHMPGYDRMNFAIKYKDRRLRLRYSKTLSRQQLFIRILPERPPSLSMIGHPTTFNPLLQSGSIQPGFVLVAGATGSGKSTLLSALLQYYLDSRPVHVITIEDPSEYIFLDGLGEVSQREIPDDVESFSAGLKHALREDPDIVLIGEIRDSDTAATALTAAETGHLVFATVHASSVPGIIDRLFGMFYGVSEAEIRLGDIFRLGVHLHTEEAPDGGIKRHCDLCWGTEEVSEYIRYREPHKMNQHLEKYVVESNKNLHKYVAG